MFKIWNILVFYKATSAVFAAYSVINILSALWFVHSCWRVCI